MRAVYVGVLIVLGWSIHAANAQPQHATLFGWEERVRRGLLDRSHVYGGRYYERGLFRTVTRRMDYEYDLDLFTYRFSPFADYTWSAAQNAFYSFAGSIDYGEFASTSRLKGSAAIGAHGRFDVVGVQQEDLRVERLFVQAGYTHDVGGGHRIGLHHTLGATKNDLDAILTYRYGTAETGWVEANLALLDWPSNIVHELITGSNRDYEVVQRYERSPRLWAVRAVAPAHRFLRAELVAGIQPRSEAVVTRQAAPDSSFVNAERTHYVGVLVEYYRSNVSVGLTAQRAYARIRRTPSAQSEYALDFGNHERTNRLGLYASYSVGWVELAQWGWIAQNRDRFFGARTPAAWTPFDFREVRILSKSRVSIGRSSGWWGGAELNVDHRHVKGEKRGGTINLPFRRNYPDQVTGDNQRLTFLVGYSYHPDVRVTLGASVDLDGDLYSGWGIPSQNREEPSRFDGGFIRVAVVW